MSKELDERFRYYATYMNDTELLTKLDCVKSEISHLVCTDVPESSAIRNLSGKTSVSGRKNSEIQTSGATETCEWTRSLQVRFWCSSVYSNGAGDPIRIIFGVDSSGWHRAISKTFDASEKQVTGTNPWSSALQTRQTRFHGLQFEDHGNAPWRHREQYRWQQNVLSGRTGVGQLSRKGTKVWSIPHLA